MPYVYDPVQIWPNYEYRKKYNILIAKLIMQKYRIFVVVRHSPRSSTWWVSSTACVNSNDAKIHCCRPDIVSRALRTRERDVWWPENGRRRARFFFTFFHKLVFRRSWSLGRTKEPRPVRRWRRNYHRVETRSKIICRQLQVPRSSMGTQLKTIAIF